MYLKSLELSGFKSFAKKVELKFTSPITGIVGPNGSGKSNIAEAFRFVLGEQSIKSLRGKRGEDLIWNGGSDTLGRGRANRASVKLTFDNTNKLFPSIDFDEVSIERVVNRDNSNEYILNGNQVRLKDIVELLAGAHIGATGHHIISQGEADRILSASIHERREIIEDALGLKIYQWKKIESLRKLEKTEENSKQVESLRREIAPHLKFLKKQCEKVEKAEELRREMISICKEYFAYEELYIKSEKNRLTKELNGPQQELRNLENDLEKAKRILTASKDHDEKSGEIIRLENNQNSLRHDRDLISRELGRIEGKISVNNKAIEREELRLHNEETKTVPLKEVEEIVSSVEKIEDFSSAKELWNKVVSLLRDFIRKHRLNNSSDSLEEIKKEMKELNKEKENCEKKLMQFDEKEEKNRLEYERLKEMIEKEKDSNREAEKQVFRIIARQDEVRNIVNSLNLQLGQVLHDEENLKKDMGEIAIMLGREVVQYESALTCRNRDEQMEVRKKIEKNIVRLEDAHIGAQGEILNEYRETEERDLFLARELEDLSRGREELLKLINDLDMRIDLEFKSGILKINHEFEKYFVLMFGGGKAELKVVKEMKRKKRNEIDDLSMAMEKIPGDEEDLDGENEEEGDGPLGLEVNISLPRKKIKGLTMLSGGERALTSIALLFAISRVNPPPFIILDETDAALDEANSKKYGDMINNLSEESQLILITHNRETMSRAGILYGVTMAVDGSSRLLSIAFDEAVRVAK